MNAPESLRRRSAITLMRLAAQILPACRREWEKAMRAELDHLQDDREALAWAIGCVVAGSKERLNAMLTGNLKISRWILIPEMLLCFVPLTIGWLDALGGSSGLMRLNADVIQRDFLHAADGTLVLMALIAGAVLGAVGPLGLATAFRLVASGRPPSVRWFRTALVIGPAVYGLFMLITRLAIGGTEALGFGAVDAFDFWSGMLLLAALPSLGAAHMLRLAPQDPIR